MKVRPLLTGIVVVVGLLMAGTVVQVQAQDTNRTPLEQNTPNRGTSNSLGQNNSQEPIITTGDTCTNSNQCPSGTECFPSPGGGPGVCGVSLSGRSSIRQVQEYNQSQAAPDQVDLWKFGSDDLLDSFQVGIAKSICAGCIGAVPLDDSGNPIADQSVLPQLVAFVGDLYGNPPANTATYVADVMDGLNIGLAQPAYAQGIGFSVLSPILNIWKIFRNIAYLFFIIIMVVIGFMIMFRQKVGQTAVTAQQAIPSVIIALLAVTFSYAIAGLLIDFMYLVMFGMGALFNKTNLVNLSAIQLGKFILLDSQLITGGVDAVSDFVDSTLNNSLIGGVAGFLSGITAAVVILLVVLFNIFRLFFNLLRIYLEIILTIVFAPVMLMLGAIPGNNAFGTWLRNLFANLAVFPAIMGLLIVFSFLVESTSESVGTSGAGFVPPYLVGTSTAGVVPFLAGLALIFALPEFVNQVKKSLGATESTFAELLKTGGRRGLSSVEPGAAIVGGATGATLGGMVAAPIAIRALARGESPREVGKKFGLRVGAGLGIGAGTPPVIRRGPALLRRAAGDIFSNLTQRTTIGTYEQHQDRKSIEAKKDSAQRGTDQAEIPSE